MSPPDPFLAAGSSATRTSSSPRWTAILASERLTPTATTDDVKTTVGSRQLGNVSLASGAIPSVVYASDRNYEYFLRTFPDDGGSGNWNAAWVGDPGGC